MSASASVRETTNTLDGDDDAAAAAASANVCRARLLNEVRVLQESESANQITTRARFAPTSAAAAAATTH